MLNALFISFIAVTWLYLLVAPRKEVPALIVLQAMLQYGFTLASWGLRLPNPLGAILLGFMVMTTVLLMWARSLPYSRQLYSIRLFFTVSQWALLLMLLILVGLRSPYLYHPGNELSDPENIQLMTLHPALKFSGNLMLFTGFFHIVLHWGQRWEFRKSLLDLGPVLIYFATLLFLRFMQVASHSQPFA